MHNSCTFRSTLPSKIHSNVIPFSATKQIITLSYHTFKLTNFHPVNNAVWFLNPLFKPNRRPNYTDTNTFHHLPYEPLHSSWSELCIYTHMTCLTYCNQAQLLSNSASPFDLLSSQILDQRSVSTRLVKIRIQF